MALPSLHGRRSLLCCHALLYHNHSLYRSIICCYNLELSVFHSSANKNPLPKNHASASDIAMLHKILKKYCAGLYLILAKFVLQNGMVSITYSS